MKHVVIVGVLSIFVYMSGAANASNSRNMTQTKTTKITTNTEKSTENVMKLKVR